jgi:hypothetical protein
MVLPSDDSTNDEDDDAGETGIADGAGGEYDRCGIGACDPTESIGNTGLGARIDGWTDRDAWVDMGLGVTCRWHVRLDVSKVRSVANSSQKSVLIADPKPLLT